MVDSYQNLLYLIKIIKKCPQLTSSCASSISSKH